MEDTVAAVFSMLTFSSPHKIIRSQRCNLSKFARNYYTIHAAVFNLAICLQTRIQEGGLGIKPHKKACSDFLDVVPCSIVTALIIMILSTSIHTFTSDLSPLNENPGLACIPVQRVLSSSMPSLPI
jgi:hypothetical protein